MHMNSFHISWLNRHVGPTVDSIRGGYMLEPHTRQAVIILQTLLSDAVSRQYLPSVIAVVYGGARLCFFVFH